MNKLRRFWERSLLNKVIVLLTGLVVICGCCPAALLGGGQQERSAAQTPAPAPATPQVEAPAGTQVAIAKPITEPTTTVEPTETTEPTKTPRPTKTPAPPTDTPEPTNTSSPPTEEPPPVGLNVTRMSLQEVFEKSNFVFDVVPLSDDRDRLIGKSPDGASLELIGPKSNLSEVSLIVVFPENDANQRQLSAIYIGGLIQNVAPSHFDEIVQWVTEQLGKPTDDAAIVTGNIRSRLQKLIATDGMVVVFSMSGVN